MRTRRGFQSALGSAAQFTEARLPFAPMATIHTTRTRARLTGTTGLVGSPAAYLSVPARGTTASTGAPATDPSLADPDIDPSRVGR